ncbi:hypothetical protein G5I_13687 [Acromyrmex echinatior]|uniref:Uncharacterized protein n=1 Tax=Acromyrmex echinatior TaxID=103372 RepID=F4X5P8_ACREC|nr:hypothetical protein G5I_13687 [Acromyrmex echinatior]
MVPNQSAANRDSSPANYSTAYTPSLEVLEKPATLNTIAREVMGRTIPSGSISMLNLLNEKSLTKIAENAGQQICASLSLWLEFTFIRDVKLHHTLGKAYWKNHTTGTTGLGGSSPHHRGGSP